jgi:8-oxo-dGTP pyrophosphatase MutT (NUDIX family)
MVHPLDPFTRLRAALDEAPDPEPPPGDRLAAVLALFIGRSDPSLLFTVRAEGLSRHAGEVSFPGGLQDPGESLIETALREVGEEIGLDGAGIEVLGALPSVHTTISGILVVPYVGMVSSSPALTINEDEIDEVVTVPVARLIEIEEAVEYERPGGERWRGFAYPLTHHTIWGATGWMLHSLLELVGREPSWPNP